MEAEDSVKHDVQSPKNIPMSFKIKNLAILLYYFSPFPQMDSLFRL